MTSSQPHLCPECREPLPDSRHRLCPACLFAQALASGTVRSGEAQADVRPAPSPEEIAAKFPQFEIAECLGRGGMGVVYKARQKSLNRWVALKILAPERVHDPRFGERFAAEAELLARLNHPHIVTIHDFGHVDGLYYLVMEFVDGVNLRDLLREGRLAPSQALAIVPPICDALQYAHEKGIVHRDIKPENLLLDRGGRIKLADFGIAALVGAAGERVGTPPYMAPEQAAPKHEVDHRADIYALGVVLYEALTGERPAREVVAPSKKIQIDVRLDEIVLRALEQNPELRYQQASSFKTQLETIASQAAPGTAAAPRKQSGGASWRDRPWLIFFAFSAAMAIFSFSLAFGLWAVKKPILPEPATVAPVAEESTPAAAATLAVTLPGGSNPRNNATSIPNRQAAILDALLTLPPAYLADIPLDHRTALVTQLAVFPSDRLDYSNGFMHYYSDSPEPKPAATSMFYLKVLPSRLGFGTVLVHMMKPRNGRAPTAANTAVLTRSGKGWEDITNQVMPAGVDRTSHFRPMRASLEVEVAPYEAVGSSGSFDYGLCRQILTWDGTKFGLQTIAARPLSKTAPARTK